MEECVMEEENFHEGGARYFFLAFFQRAMKK